jgi:hypothetical protein
MDLHRIAANGAIHKHPHVERWWRRRSPLASQMDTLAAPKRRAQPQARFVIQPWSSEGSGGNGPEER